MSQASSTPQADWGPPVIATPPPPPPVGWFQSPPEKIEAPAAPQPVQSEPRIVYSLYEIEDRQVRSQGLPPGTPLTGGVQQMWDNQIGAIVTKTFRNKIGTYPTRQAAVYARPDDASKRYEIVEDIPKAPEMCPTCGLPGGWHDPCKEKHFASVREAWESSADAKAVAEQPLPPGIPNPLMSAAPNWAPRT